MKGAFHYSVKVKLIRYQTKDDVGFINFQKDFENDNPIRSREDAFKEYNEWIKDLYTGLGREGQYTSDKQARIDLQNYISPLNKIKLQINRNEIELGSPVIFGIGVYLIIDQPFYSSWESENEYDKAGEELLLHGIGTTDIYDDPLEISDALNNEILYYEHYNYDKGGYERKANFYDSDIDDVDEIHFLETPFDWTSLDIKPEEFVKVEHKRTLSIEEIIANGEGEQVEFKPTLSYHFTNHTWQGKYDVNYIIARTICSFLNSKGGILFIGVKDNGEIQGLDFDFRLADKENKKDFFKNDFDRVFDNFIGFAVKPIVNGDFYELDGETIFVVEVKPRTTKPAFLKAKEGKKEFWVRGTTSCRQLTDIEDIFNYWTDRETTF
jgi:hypothetical protein